MCVCDLWLHVCVCGCVCVGVCGWALSQFSSIREVTGTRVSLLVAEWLSPARLDSENISTWCEDYMLPMSQGCLFSHTAWLFIAEEHRKALREATKAMTRWTFASHWSRTVSEYFSIIQSQSRVSPRRYQLGFARQPSRLYHKGSWSPISRIRGQAMGPLGPPMFRMRHGNGWKPLPK